MRIALAIDQDVLEKARKAAARLHSPLRMVIHQALRIGLGEIEKPSLSKPYRTIPHDMGLKRGFSLDNVQETLAQAEGEDFR